MINEDNAVHIPLFTLLLGVKNLFLHFFRIIICASVVFCEITVEQHWEGVLELTPENFDHEVSRKPYLVLFYIPG